jgi:hypothetical protein
VAFSSSLDGSAGLCPGALPALRTFISILLIGLLSAGTASAQSLQRLTVTQLTLASDTAQPHIETPFHLIITVRVRERVQELDNLDLPILAELELLGDEHTLVADSSGTTYRETITVIAHHSGDITIAPVTLDARDARTGRAQRYFSNALTVHVGGLTAAAAAFDVWASVRAFLAFMFRVALFCAGIACAALLLYLLYLRRKRPAPPPAPPAVTLPPPIPVVRDRKSILLEALDVLRLDPTRAGAMRARHIVRRMIGVSDTETLADVLRRPEAADPELRACLQALERAGFTHEGDLRAAIDAARVQLERVTR